MQRESFRSRLGFLLVSAGCAIGIGNVWRFPYIAGLYGGGLFVLIYLICLLVMGVPVLTMELAVGRASKKSAVLAYKALEPKGSKWHIHGWFCLLGCVMLMMYYTTVTGWMVSYFGKFLIGTFHAGMDTASASGVFGSMLSQPGRMAFWTEAVVIAGFLVCSFGLQNGLERISKGMMLALLALILILAIHSLTLPGAAEGMKFYLLPTAKSVQENGLGTIITGAMNQAFFTLSVGMGGMAIFGSYVGKDRSLMGESIHIIILDTLVAVIAGIIIFPACFTYDVEVTAGPSLLFDTMATVFNNMAGGRWWGTLFFLFMVFAAMSTVLGVCENILAMVRELTGWSRPAGCVACGVGCFLLALTTALGFSVFHFQPFAAGTTWLDFWDFLVSNNIMPIGSILLAVFCCYKVGWGWDKFLEEANAGKGLKVQPWMKPVFKYFVPAAVLFIYVYGMINFAWK